MDGADPPDASPVTSSSRRGSRALAALLSFLLPGAGQLVTGRVVAGLLFLAPLALAVLAGLVASGGDRSELLGLVLEPNVLLGIVAANGLVFLWRAAAIGDAWRGAGQASPRGVVSVAVLVGLLAITGVTHYAVGARVMAARDTVQAVFASSDDEVDDGFGEILETPAPTPVPSIEPGATRQPTPQPTPTPVATPTPAPTPRPGPLADGRLDLLLVGGDAGPGRFSLRTDTLMVLSVEEASGEAALFSIPRNMVNVPLPKESRKAFPCRCYPRMINSLYVYASGHPGAFPGKDETRGLRAVQMAIGTLTGRKLDGMVLVELQGFVRLINAIGGIDVNAPDSVYDRRYPLENGRGYVEVFIKAGKQHMTGRKALMYARSRHQDSDYGRMRRQQIVISAIGKKLLKEPLALRVPELLEIAKDHLWTNLKAREVPELARLAEQADLKGMKTVRLIPPRYPEYLDARSIKRIRSVVAKVFDKAKPLPTPKPTPRPTLDRIVPHG